MVKTLGLQCRGCEFEPGRGTKIPHAVWLGQKKRKKAHMLTQHTVLALVSGTRTKAACVWFYLPNSLLSLPLIIKLPTPTSEIWSSATEKDSYSHCTNTGHRDEPLTQAGPSSSPTLTPIQGLMQSSVHDPSQPEFLLGIYLTGVGEKEIYIYFFPLRRKRDWNVNPQWSATIVSISWEEMSQENEANTGRDTDTRDREEDRQFMVLDPAVPEAVSENELCPPIYSLILFG